MCQAGYICKVGCCLEHFFFEPFMEDTFNINELSSPFPHTGHHCKTSGPSRRTTLLFGASRWEVGEAFIVVLWLFLSLFFFFMWHLLCVLTSCFKR